MPLPMVRNPTRSSSPKSVRFPLGSSVEVRSNDIGFQGAWYEARITKIPRQNRRHYTVTYSTLVDDSNTPLKESVLPSFIRPRPPIELQSNNNVFGLHQLVDAFHNDGWWLGVVNKLTSKCDGLYSVCFPTSREEFVFKSLDLRRSLEWVKGEWVSVQDCLLDDKEGGHALFGDSNSLFQEGGHALFGDSNSLFQEGGHALFGEGTLVEVSGDKENFGEAWFVGTVVKFIGRTYFLVEYKNIKVGSEYSAEYPLKEIVDLQYIRPCPPMSESTSYNVLDEVEVFYEDGWYLGMVLVILPGSDYIVKCKHKDDDKTVHHTSLRPHLFWIDGQWIHVSKDNYKEVADGSDNSSQMGNKPGLESGDEFLRPLKMLKTVNVPEEHSQSVGEIKSDIRTNRKRKSHASKQSVHLVPLLTSTNNDGEIASEKFGEPSFDEDNPSQPCTADDKQTDIMEDFHAPPEINPLIPGAKLTECTEFQLPISNSEAFYGEGEEIRICADKLAESTKLAQSFPLIEDSVLIPCGPMSDKVPELQMVAVGPTANGPSLSNVDIVCNENEFSPTRLLSSEAFVEVEDSSSILLSKNGVVDQSERTPQRSLPENLVVEMEAPYDTAASHLLHSEHPGKHHEPTPSILPSVSTSFVNSIEETRSLITAYSREDTPLHDRLNIEDRETTLMDPSPLESSSEKMILPFSKFSEMSELVVSALDILPQQPHFQPLLEHAKELREGLACGLMITFASLVRGMSNLCILDSEQDFEEKLEVLDCLEKHGFSIQPVRARLEKLLEIRNMFGQLEQKQNSMGAQVKQLEEAKGKDNLFLSKLEKSVVELEERLASIEEERSSLILKIKKNESEIADLKARVQATEEKTVSVKHQFDASVAAPW